MQNEKPLQEAKEITQSVAELNNFLKGEHQKCSSKWYNHWNHCVQSGDNSEGIQSD
jgi:hypothetical protein